MRDEHGATSQNGAEGGPDKATAPLSNVVSFPLRHDPEVALYNSFDEALIREREKWIARSNRLREALAEQAHIHDEALAEKDRNHDTALRTWKKLAIGALAVLVFAVLPLTGYLVFTLAGNGL